MNKPINLVAVHDGVFHADDVFSVATLRLLFPDLKVIRTRKPDLLATADLRVDVGGENDIAKGTLDHHQVGGAGFRTNGVPFAGFGLTWNEFGDAVVGAFLGLTDPEVIKAISGKVCTSLVQPIDAWDNNFSLMGVDITGPGMLAGTTVNVGPVAKGVFPYSVSQMVIAMNPSWQEDESFDDAFGKATIVASIVLEREITRAAGLVMAQDEVRKAVAAAEHCNHPEFLMLDRFVPLGDALDDAPSALFVVYPDMNGEWCVKTIGIKGSRQNRKPLPATWAGKKDADLVEVTGVQDATFCHPGRFIAGAKSRGGAIRMARQAVVA